MMLDYRIKYTDHRNDEHEVLCSSFEDAERIAQFLAEIYVSCELFDNMYIREYIKDNNGTNW